MSQESFVDFANKLTYCQLSFKANTNSFNFAKLDWGRVGDERKEP